MPDRFVPQVIRNAICLVLAKAGIIIPINNAITGNATAGTTIPAMANPLPVKLPPLFSILTRLTIPRIIAGIAVIAQVKILRIPRINAAMAMPLLLTPIHGACAEDEINAAPQALQTWASSEFCVPHFVQYLLISP